MKLDYNCVRDVLLTLEEKAELIDDGGIMEFTPIEFYELCDELPKYSSESIMYASHKLYEADYIRAAVSEGDFYIGRMIYYDITFEGHQFLNSIRNKSVWDKLKPIAGSLSFEAVKDLAGQIASKIFF